MAYKGEHLIDFEVSNHAPLILFLGENGHGKTTIQHACKWCLYEETKEKNEKIPFIDLVNRKALQEHGGKSVLEMFVELEWEEEGKIYNLRRTFEPLVRGIPAPRARLRIDAGNPVPASSIQDHVQRFLAKEISHFFFFDGETQDEFDKMTNNHNSAAFIRSEIEKSLNIPVINSGISWLKTRKNEESIALIKANNQNEKIRKKGEDLESARIRQGKIEEEIQKQQKNLDEATLRIETLQSEVENIEEAQEINSKINELRGKVKTLKESRSQTLDSISEIFSDNPWIPLAEKLFEIKKDLETNIFSMEDRLRNNESIASQITLLEQLRTERRCPLCNSPHEKTQEEIGRKIADLNDQVDGLDSSVINQLKAKEALFSEFGFNYSKYVEIRNLQKDYDADGGALTIAMQSLSEKENQLALFGSADIANIVTSMRSLTEDAEEARSNKEAYERDKAEVDREIDKLESAVGKGISPQKRIAHNAFAYLVNLLEAAKEDYVSLVRKQVESFSSETFLRIISDKKYQGLRINDNFGVELVLPDGKADPLRSTGQGKVSTIALVSGLIKTAMNEGFILMDTPFVSLDTGHRQSVSRWAVDSGFKVSLFMHSGEFDWTRDRSAFGDYVGRVYRILKVDNDESRIDVMST